MRTSEISGAGALGFRAGKGLVIARFSNVSIAVAVTAFLSACLFLLYDVTRIAESADAEQQVQITLENQHIAGIAGRGLLAFALAGLITLASCRRPADTGRNDAILASIRAEQRRLARRYHEEKLKAEAANRAKTNFLAHVSHDIRTPLNHIIGFAELMEQETYGALGHTRYRDYVQSIKCSGQHLLNSFATILDLVELEGGQKPLRQDPVLLDEIMDSVVKRFQGQIQRAGLGFKVGPATGAVLRGDRLGLTRMIGNIMDNAVRFTQAGGTVTLAAFAADDGVVIEISDTGIGMSEERLATLSQPFAMGDATFSREGQGPGLGISIARAIAALSGGNIAIDSSPSLGTTVAISLPTEPAAAELAA
ncbi:HAMP domain-containing sensor histidine kinase [Devosia sp. YIM 151766]|uniref:sensor histidine kinase n=1 Tax=Devosia sp. YIM 151766 TaxID=3017325 RepID=UPI00255C6910|nr:HAMP domain-containing sensor histidine kinase [Devosia sp. YIM 151766]WIY53694.1 HAMP domain-containing sensor histidine kinase [Devosia sp. YIM 151766]